MGRLERVDQLLCNQGREWDKEKLHLLVPAADRAQIEALRPGGWGTEDTIAWDYTQSGSYSVKSGYWVERDLQRKRKGLESIDQPSVNGLYRDIWKKNVTPKIKHFLWKCMSNTLAVANNLERRHVTREGGCARCMMPETVNHLLFTCTFARLVWTLSPIPAPVEGEWGESIFNNLHSTCGLGGAPSKTKEDNIAPWLLWRIWKNRNELLFKGREQGAMEVINQAREDWEEWEKRREGNVVSEHVQAIPRVINWQRPPTTWFKCNVDAAWSSESGRSGIGWILRDHHGRMRWMGGRAIPLTGSALEAEAEGLRWALLSMIQFGISKVIFETDASKLVSLVEGKSQAKHLSPIIQDIQQLMDRIEEAGLRFSHRETNQVAHQVARKAVSFMHYEPSLYSLPPCWIKHFVVKDLRVISVG